MCDCSIYVLVLDYVLVLAVHELWVQDKGNWFKLKLSNPIDQEQYFGPKELPQ